VAESKAEEKVKGKNHGRSKRDFRLRPSDKSSVEVKTLGWLEAVA
jgi:hypothetical protein